MQCFCGCGRKVTFGLRPINKRGMRLRRDAHRVEHFIAIGLVSPNANLFLEQADEWCDVFSESVHLGIKPDEERPGLTEAYLNWLRHVPKAFISTAGFGKQVRDAGLSTDEAVGLIQRGEWDPYAGFQMPVPNPGFD